MLRKIAAFISGLRTPKRSRKIYKITEDQECVTPADMCSGKIEKLNHLQSAFKQNYDPTRHAVVCSSTGSGKTGVAEVASSAFLKEGKRVVMLAPTKELTRELYDTMCEVHGSTHIGRFTGSDKNDKDINLKLLIVATTEAFLSAYRSELEWATKAKLMIVDEAHNILDPGRGGSLDAAMTVCRENDGKLLLMSGTFNVADDIAAMLDADIYKSEVVVTKVNINRIFCADDIDAAAAPYKLPKDIRPTTTGFVYNKESQRIRELTKLIDGFDPEEAVIIFVPTKAIGYCLSEHLNMPFHCADVSAVEKARIVRQFNDGTIKRIIATSTLAQGVNTPADKVVICGLTLSIHNFLDSPTIRQMAGRVARGKAEGHAYILCSDIEAPFIDKEPYGKAIAPPTETLLMTKLSNRSATNGDLIASLSKTYWASTVQKNTISEQVQRHLKHLTACDFIRTTNNKLTLSREGTIIARFFINPSAYIGYMKLARRLMQIPDTSMTKEQKGCILMSHLIDRVPGEPPKKYENDMAIAISDNSLKAEFSINHRKAAMIMHFCHKQNMVPPHFGITLQNSVDRWIGMLKEMKKYKVHQVAPGEDIIEPMLKTLHKASINAQYRAELKKEKMTVLRQAELILKETAK